MEAAATFVVREKKLTRVLRLVLRGGGAILLGLIPIAYFGFTPRPESPYALFFDVSMGILAVCVLIYLGQLLRRTDLVASVSPEGLSFAYKKPAGLCEIVSCRWDEVKAIEVLRASSCIPFQAQAAVCIRLRNENSLADFPLKRIPQRISDQFIDTLREYWPDLDSPWEVQFAKRKTMDSSAR